MTFLERTDFDVIIRSSELDRLLASSQIDDEVLLTQAVDIALDEIVSFITGRYDADATFSATGDSRNKLVVARCADMALYHLYANIAGRDIPTLRQQRYSEAMDLFKGVSKGTRFLNLPIIPIDEQTTYFLYGGNRPYNTF